MMFGNPTARSFPNSTLNIGLRANCAGDHQAKSRKIERVELNVGCFIWNLLKALGLHSCVLPQRAENLRPKQSPQMSSTPDHFLGGPVGNVTSGTLSTLLKATIHHLPACFRSTCV